MSTTALPWAGVQEIAYDANTSTLYGTATGNLYRYDAAGRQALPTFDSGLGTLTGLDVASDGKAVYAADATSPRIQRIDAASGAATSLAYVPTYGETNAFDVAVLADNKAYVTTQFGGTGYTSIHAIDLSTGVDSTPGGGAGSIWQRALLDRSPDRSTLLWQESGISNGPFGVIDAATGAVLFRKGTSSYGGYTPGAVSRDGALVAISVAGATILDRGAATRAALTNVTGGMAFDPNRALFYGVDATSNEVVAYDTNTWAVRYRIAIGSDVAPAERRGTGAMTVSADSRQIFLATATGVLAIDNPQPDGVARGFTLAAQSTFVTSGSRVSLTVTAVDATGATVPGYTGRVSVSSSDAGALLAAAYRFTPADAGTHTFSVLMRTIGKQTITAYDGADPTIAVTSAPITVAPSGQTFMPLDGIRDVAIDEARNVMYATAGTGLLYRFDLTTRSMLAPIAVGTKLVGIDLSPDGKTLYAVDGVASTGTNRVYRIDTATGAVTTLNYAVDGDESGGYDIAVLNNGEALFTETFNGSGWISLRRLDLATGTITFFGRSVRQDSLLDRSADGGTLVIQESNISSGPVEVYDAATRRFVREKSTDAFVADAPIAVSADGSLIAKRVGGTAAIYSRQLTLIATLPAGLDGGYAFDPTRDTFYAVDSTQNVLVAFNTNTWTERYRVPVGRDVFSAFRIVNGKLIVRADGRSALLTTGDGVQSIDLPASTPMAAAFEVRGLSGVAAIGATQTFEVRAIAAVGDVVPGYRGTVAFAVAGAASSSSDVDLPAAYTFTAADAGRHTFTATFLTGGAKAISASDVDAAIFGSANVTVGNGLLDRTLVADGRDAAYDAKRRVLYTSTGGGLIQRFDVASQSLLAPLSVPGDAGPIDLTLDGNSLLVGDRSAGYDVPGLIFKIDLASGATTTYSFQTGTERGIADLAVVGANAVLFTTYFAGSGQTPVRRLDLATGAITTTGISLDGGRIRRNATATRVILDGSYGDPPLAYDGATGTFKPLTGSTSYVNRVQGVSADGSLVATLALGGLQLRDATTMAVVRTINVSPVAAAFDATRPIVYALDPTGNVLRSFDVNTGAQLDAAPAGAPVIYDGGFLTPGADGQAVYWTRPDETRVIAVGGSIVIDRAATTGRVSEGTPVVLRARVFKRDGTLATSFVGTLNVVVDGVAQAVTFIAGDAGSRTFDVTFTDSGTRTVGATLPAGGAAPATLTLSVANLAPTASFSTDGAVIVGAKTIARLAGAADASAADVAAGFTYSFDFNNDGDFADAGDVLNSTSPSASFAFASPGTYAIRGRITDKDGGYANYTTFASVTAALPPTATFAGGPFVEGGTQSLIANASVIAGQSIVKWEWDLDYDGATFNSDTPGQYGTATQSLVGVDLGAVDGASSRTFAVRMTDNYGVVVIVAKTIAIANFAPTATLALTANATGGATATFANGYDSGVADRAAGFKYSFDFNNDGDFTDAGEVAGATSATATFAYATAGTYVVHGRIADKDGGFTDYRANVTVTAPPPTSPAKLAGTPIGTAGSIGGNTIAKAFDGSLATFVDLAGSGPYAIGLDLGIAKSIASVKFAPRATLARRMTGGVFQASNSATFATGVVTLATIAQQPADGVFTTLSFAVNPAAFRYVRYLAPAGSFGNVAELQFFGTGGTVTPPPPPPTPTTTKLVGTAIGTAGSIGGNGFAKALDGDLATYVDSTTANGAYVGLDLGTARVVKQVRFAPRATLGRRMVGGYFQGSNTADFGIATTLFTVATAPPDGVLSVVDLTGTTAYRYVRYVAPASSFGNVAEVQFYG